MNINNLINESTKEKNLKICELVAEKYSKYFCQYELNEIKNYFDKWNEIMNQAHNSNCWGEGVSIDEHLEAFKDFFESKEELRKDLTRESMVKLKKIIRWIDNDDIMTITFFKKYIDEKQVESPYIMSAALIAHDFQNETIEIYNYYNQKMEKLRERAKRVRERDGLIDDGDDCIIYHEQFIGEKNWLKHEENVYIYLKMREMRDITCPLTGDFVSKT